MPYSPTSVIFTLFKFYKIDAELIVHTFSPDTQDQNTQSFQLTPKSWQKHRH